MNYQKVKVAVLDTNVYSEHPLLAGSEIAINNIADIENVSEDCGHGTAVCSIILKECAHIELTVFPMFKSSQDSIEIEILEKVLGYIRDSNIVYDIINMSNGVVQLDNPDNLYKLCKSITDKGTIIVAAYDNSGIMTYPACFPNVIGVDTNPRINYAKEFEFVENSPVNIRGYERQQRVAWDKPEYILTRGSSFIAPYITGIIANVIFDGKRELASLMAELKSKATISTKMTLPKKIKNEIEIKKAITFPFNKEIHSIVMFCEDLPLELTGVYDFKYFMRIGKKVSSVINQPLNRDYTIQSIDNVNWEEDFDTIIIGHLNEILGITGSRFLDELIEKIVKYKKNIYSFDNYIYKNYFCNKSNYMMKCFYPYIDKKCVPYNLFGKMWVPSTPVLAVMGTRSQQGKFTLQLLLKKHLQLKGFKIRHIASEPTGWLFDADGVFPFGYSNTIGIDYFDTVLTLNNMIHNVEINGVDLVITGCQSGTVPYNCYSSQRIMLAQAAFLYGTIPDAVFLCVCPDDDIDYVRRTINFIESSVDTKVLGIFVFPVLTEIYMGHLLKRKNISGTEELNQIILNIEEAFKIPVVELSQEGVEKQVQNIINYFCS